MTETPLNLHRSDLFDRQTLNLSGREAEALDRLLDVYLGTEKADPREAELRAIRFKLKPRVER